MLFRFSLNNENKGALVLAQDPQGWRDLETILKRGLEYHGTFYETMVQLEFSCGSGKEYIDEIYNEYGVDAVIEIKIEISCDSGGVSNISNDYSIDYSIDYGSFTQGSNVIQYETFYEGVLDLSKYNTTTRSTFCDIIQSNFIQKVINRFDTKVELTQDKSLDDITLLPIVGFPSQVEMHSKSILLGTRFTGFDYREKFIKPIGFPTQDYVCSLPYLFSRDEIGGAFDAQSLYMRGSDLPNNILGYTFMSPFYANSTGNPISFNISFNLKCKIKFILDGNNTLPIKLIFSHNCVNGPRSFPNPAGATEDVFEVVPSQLYTALNPYEKDIDINGTVPITVLNGRTEFAYIFFEQLVDGGDIIPTIDFEIIIEEFEISYDLISKKNSSQAEIFKIHEVGAAITQRITSQEDSFRSTLLGRKNSEPNQYNDNGCFSFAGILSGKHIRGLNVPLFVSMNDLYRSINSYYDIGLGFIKEGNNYVIRVEEKEFFYDSSVVLIQCQFANEIKTSVAKEYYITELFIGYEKWETESINGILEVNSKRTYNTGVKAIDNKVNYESIFVGGMYPIELIRRQGSSTTDNDYDNDLFIICLNRSVDGNGVPDGLAFTEQAENFSSVTGILVPEDSYNLRITPVRNLIRHIKSISASMYKEVGKLIKFTYSEGNLGAVTAIDIDSCIEGNYNGELLSEKQDVQWDDVNIGVNPIWIPEYIEFEYPLSFFDYLNIKNNPYKTIEVSNGNANFMKGFIIEVRWKPVGGIAYFKLLRVWQ